MVDVVSDRMSSTREKGSLQSPQVFLGGVVKVRIFRNVKNFFYFCRFSVQSNPATSGMKAS